MQIPASACLLVLLLGAGVASIRGAAEKSYQVIVSSGEFDREEAVVPLPLPSGVADRWQLVDARGAPVPFQIAGGGRGHFILRSLPRASRATYRLSPTEADARSAESVQVTRDGNRLKIAVNGVTAFCYQAEPGELPRPDIKPIFQRGGYIHPIFSPSGKQVTDDYPPNHIHHHGIWFAWTKTEFEGRQPDFWNMGEAKGKVEFVSLNKTWSGAVFGGFQSAHRFVDLTAAKATVALTEVWEVRVFNVGTGSRRFFLFDLVSTQECASASPLKLPKYYYGGLGLRGNRDWNGKENAFFLTSDGEMDRVRGNETRGRWCHVGGSVDGERTGVAIFNHPENFRAPQPMRLHPAEPFFCFAPSQLGDWEIAPGKPYISRYRFVVADGPPDRERLERLWNDYANPPSVKVEALENQNP